MFTLVAPAPPKADDCSVSATSGSSLRTSSWLLVLLSIIAPLLTLSGILGLLGNGLSRLLLLGRRMRGNLLIVCGIGDRGMALLREETAGGQKARKRRIAIAIDESQAAQLDELDSFLIVGDAREKRTLQLAGAARSISWSNRGTAVVVATQNPRLSEEIAEAASETLGGSRSAKTSWIAYDCASKRSRLGKLIEEPLSAAGPFPVDLMAQQAGKAVAKALERPSTEIPGRVVVVGKSDPLLAVDIILGLMRYPGATSRSQEPVLILPDGMMERATSILESANDVRWSPARVDVCEALRAADEKEYGKLVSEFESADVVIVAVGDDDLACDIVELFGRNRYLSNVRLVVCLTKPNPSVNRVVCEHPGLSKRTRKVLLSDVASANEIEQGIRKLRKLLSQASSSIDEAAQGVKLAAQGVELLYGAGARTPTDLASYITAVTGNAELVYELEQLNWAIVGLHGTQIWEKVALSLTADGKEDSAFLAWCEWLREVGPSARNELIEDALVEIESVVESVVNNQDGALTGAQAVTVKTVTALLALAKTVLPGNAKGSSVALITGRWADGRADDLAFLVKAAVAKQFCLDKEQLQKRWDQEETDKDRRRATFGSEAGFRGAFTPSEWDHEKVAVVSPDPAFAKLSQNNAPNAGEGDQNATRLQQLLNCWGEELERTNPNLESSAVLSLYFSGDDTALVPMEAALARGLGFGRIAVVGEAAKSHYESPISRDFISLPLDRMTLRSFLNWRAPEPAQNAPLAADPFGRNRARIDSWAECLQKNYVEMNAKLGLNKLPGDPAMQSWPKLIGYFRESTRATARDWPNKAAALEPKPLKEISAWVSGREEVFTPRDAEPHNYIADHLTVLGTLELLAEMEHGRWSCERIMSGWSSGQRDIGKKLTDKAKPWDDPDALGDFDNSHRDLDRQQVLCCLRLAEAKASWRTGNVPPGHRPAA